MKLTKEQSKKLRWVDWPYSEVNVIKQTRVLDDRVSRILVYIELVINPLTFEIVSQNVEKFDKQLNIWWLLAHADNRWRDGYVVAASPEIQRTGWSKDQEDLIEIHRKNAERTLIAMHKFTMRILGI